MKAEPSYIIDVAFTITYSWKDIYDNSSHRNASNLPSKLAQWVYLIVNSIPKEDVSHAFFSFA